LTISYLIILGAIAIVSIGVVDAETANAEVNPTKFHETLHCSPNFECSSTFHITKGAKATLTISVDTSDNVEFRVENPNGDIVKLDSGTIPDTQGMLQVFTRVMFADVKGDYTLYFLEPIPHNFRATVTVVIMPNVVADIPPRPIPTLKGDISTIGVGSHPFDIAVNPTTNKIYINNIFSDTVSVIDGSNNTIDATIKVGVEPKGIAVNPITNTIYVTSQVDNTVSVIDGSDNTVIDIINVDKSPQDVAVNPTTNTIYVSHSAVGIVSVIDGSDNTVIDTINLGVNPNYYFDFPGIAVNPQTETIYVAKKKGILDQLVSIIDGSDNSYMFDRLIGFNAHNVAVNPTTNTIYVTHDEASVSILDGSDNTFIDTINLEVNHDYYPHFPGIAVNPTTNTIYVTNSIENTALAIDGSNNRVVGTIDVGAWPEGVAVNPATNTIYVANGQGSSISVIVLDSKPPVKEKPQKSVIEETTEKEPLQGIAELIEQIDDTLGDQVSLQIDEESVQMVEESAQMVVASIQADDESIQNLTNLLPYMGIIIAGIIGTIIVIKKRNTGKDDEDSEDFEYYDDEEKGLTPRSKPIEQKFQDMQKDSQLDNVGDEGPEQIIENKLHIISKLQEYKIGDYHKLEEIKQSLIADGSFTLEANGYLEEKYEEYKKLSESKDKSNNP